MCPNNLKQRSRVHYHVRDRETHIHCRVMITSHPPKVIWEELVVIPTGYNGMPQIHPQNCSFSFSDHHPHLMHPSLDGPHSPPQTACRSNQSFCHSTQSGYTERQAGRRLSSRAPLSNFRAPVTIRLPRSPAYMYLHSLCGATVGLQHRTPPVSKFKGLPF